LNFKNSLEEFLFLVKNINLKLIKHLFEKMLAFLKKIGYDGYVSQ